MMRIHEINAHIPLAEVVSWFHINQPRQQIGQGLLFRKIRQMLCELHGETAEDACRKLFVY